MVGGYKRLLAAACRGRCAPVTSGNRKHRQPQATASAVPPRSAEPAIPSAQPEVCVAHLVGSVTRRRHATARATLALPMLGSPSVPHVAQQRALATRRNTVWGHPMTARRMGSVATVRFVVPPTLLVTLLSFVTVTPFSVPLTVLQRRESYAAQQSPCATRQRSVMAYRTSVLRTK